MHFVLSQNGSEQYVNIYIYIYMFIYIYICIYIAMYIQKAGYKQTTPKYYKSCMISTKIYTNDENN